MLAVGRCVCLRGPRCPSGVEFGHACRAAGAVGAVTVHPVPGTASGQRQDVGPSCPTPRCSRRPLAPDRPTASRPTPLIKASWRYATQKRRQDTAPVHGCKCDALVGGVVRRKLRGQTRIGGFPPRRAMRRMEKVRKECREDAAQTWQRPEPLIRTVATSELREAWCLWAVREEARNGWPRTPQWDVLLEQ